VKNIALSVEYHLHLRFRIVKKFQSVFKSIGKHIVILATDKIRDASSECVITITGKQKLVQFCLFIN